MGHSRSDIYYVLHKYLYTFKIVAASLCIRRVQTFLHVRTAHGTRLVLLKPRMDTLTVEDMATREYESALYVFHAYAAVVGGKFRTFARL